MSDKPTEDLLPVTTLHIDVVGTREKRYAGDFVYTVPNLGKQIEIGRRKAAQLPNGAVADPTAQALVEAICYLDVTITRDTKTPAWWDPMNLHDSTPVLALYAEALGYERRFHGENALPERDREEGAEAADGGVGGEEADAGVERKVQPPSKRRETLAAHGSRGD